MPTAKSYDGMEIMGQPFEHEGKMYVRVKGKCPRCGGSGHYSYNQMDGTRCYGCNGTGVKMMDVRWYTDAQRASMDKAAEKRAAAKAVKIEENRVRFAARNALGFGDAGFITILVGDNDFIKDWRTELPQHTVWYNEFFGWFIPGNRTPETIPSNLRTIRLNWEVVMDKNDPEGLEMRDNEEVKSYVQTLIYGKSKSEYQGSPNEWLTREVVIKKNIAADSRYGESHIHIMEDADENQYVWTTASKNLEEGATYTIKMKVKEHKEYKGAKQTIVYYCKVQ